MIRRVPGLSGFEFVALPPGSRPLWTLRQPPEGGQLSTIDAGLRAAEALFGEPLVRPLARSVEAICLRHLVARGKVARQEGEARARELLGEGDAPDGATG